jgi:hypothetical protein
MNEEHEATPWSAQQLKAIAGYVTAGATIPHACEAAGVKWTTAKNWMEKGKKGLYPFTLFREAMAEAKALHRVGLRLVIMGAAKRGDWRAAAYLEAHREFTDAHNASGQGRHPQPLPDPNEERVVLLYPVPMPEGADISQLQLLPGHAIETTAEPVPPAKGDNDADD